MGKRTKARRRARSDAPISPDFEHAEAMTGEGNARVVVFRRVRTIDRLFRKGDLTKAQMRGLEAYHDAWFAARLDGGRSCLATGGGGTPQPRSEKVAAARSYEQSLRACIPLLCLDAVDAIVLAGQSTTLAASTRVPSAIGFRSDMARARRSIRRDHTDAVVVELRIAGDALADAARVAA